MDRDRDPTFQAFHAPTPAMFERREDGTALVRLRLPCEARADEVLLRTEPDNEERLEPMRRVDPPVATAAGAADHWAWWEGRLRPDPIQPVTRYAFKLLAGGVGRWLSAAGPSPFFPERDLHFRWAPGYEPARWVWDQVFYQILPDRFRDGDPSNNVRDGEYLYEGRPVVARRWDELPDRRQGAREFFGGDLQGITEKLDYLEELGVTALYLNPVFESPSSHKYDTLSYDRVDPHLGGDEALAELCEALRARAMRVVLDAVVNHTSERHPWFDRDGEHGGGAYADPGSPYRGRYAFADPEDPDTYVGWYGVRTLPVLDFADPGVRRDVYEAEDAVLRRWMRPPYRIDGWRFDVIHMLGEGPGAGDNASYVRSFREALREENPQAYVLGEHFHEATLWLQGDQEDASMNYFGFAAPLLAFFGRRDHRGHGVEIDAAELQGLLTRARARLPFEIQLSQLNLLDSHDTERFLTAVGGDRGLAMTAAALLMTYIGVPCVYYGDEIGLEGGRDPDCRRPMPWDEAAWDRDLREHYRHLIALRRREPALRYGALLPLHAAGDAIAWARVLDGEAVVTAATRGAAETVALPVGRCAAGEVWEDALGGERFTAADGMLELPLPERGARVLRALRDEDA